MSNNVDRRKFLGLAGTVTGAGLLAATGIGTGGSVANAATVTDAAPLPERGNDRLLAGYTMRLEAARRDYGHPFPVQPLNGDEKLPRYIATYVKGFPHDDIGEVDPSAYQLVLRALSTGRAADFDRIPLGVQNGRPMLDPQSIFAVDLQGPDSHRVLVPVSPSIGSAANSAEMAELYWMALLRDVPFTDYPTNPLVAEAAASLSRFADFSGPKENGQVTPGTLFRWDVPGDLVGPFMSQFMLRDIQYGTQHIRQLHDTVKPGVDYLADFTSWLAAQRGAPFALGAGDRDFVNTRFIQNGRDMAHFVHFDQSYQAYLNAALILLTSGLPPAQLLNPGNPYVKSANQGGFATFGGPHILTLIAEGATRALRAALFQQWGVQRRIRPEEVGGRIEVQLSRQPGRYAGLVGHEILESDVLDRIRSKYGTNLLPQAFPEGSPMSPDYPSGHSTLAGAAITILKAWFNESTVLPNPVVPDATGTTLVPYTGADAGQITIGGELNKLAGNIGAGRDFGGVHYRGSNRQGFALGEGIAIGLMIDQKHMFNEDAPLTFTTFDGTKITI